MVKECELIVKIYIKVKHVQGMFYMFVLVLCFIYDYEFILCL